jgi:hypothetical protein
VLFLFRRNTLRRLISVLANNYDRDAKQLNGTHKSHVHSKEEVPFLHKQLGTSFLKCLCFVPPLHFLLSILMVCFTWICDQFISHLF